MIETMNILYEKNYSLIWQTNFRNKSFENSFI